MRVQPKVPRNKSADDASGNSQQDVDNKAIARALHDLAGGPARNQAGNNPRNEAHCFLLTSPHLEPMVRRNSPIWVSPAARGEGWQLIPRSGQKKSNELFRLIDIRSLFAAVSVFVIRAVPAA